MAKSEPARLDKYVLRWMSDVRERLGAERVGDALSGAVLGVARTKALVDRNVASLLSLANIPSRTEYQRMMSRIDVLQNRIVDLNRRLDAMTGDLTVGRRGRKKNSPHNGAGKRARRGVAGARKRAK